MPDCYSHWCNGQELGMNSTPFKCVYRLPIQLVPDSQHFSKKNIATGFSCCPDHRRDVLVVLDCSG